MSVGDAGHHITAFPNAHPSVDPHIKVVLMGPPLRRCRPPGLLATILANFIGLLLHLRMVCEDACTDRSREFLHD